ncbi:hypothetical protein [Ktedonobacter sp. SOSP1-85]|uniref:hypothetical protein n=1 Tax=Ktedonobacter sp. SOSP1-85 TaxID=2778367 RepID=UPI001916209F|nr:hypothetical protein [Ktedonobacter sp. SOSP1-85]
MSKNTSWFMLCATVCCLLWSSILLTACGSQAPEVRGKNTPHTIARDNIEEKHATPTPDTPYKPKPRHPRLHLPRSQQGPQADPPIFRLPAREPLHMALLQG